MKSAFSATDRIVGGANAGSAIPWQVSLRQRWVVFPFSTIRNIDVAVISDSDPMLLAWLEALCSV